MQLQATSHTFGEKRIFLALTLVVGLLITAFTLHPQVAKAASTNLAIPALTYNCSTSHCYGVNSWSNTEYGQTNFTGDETNPDVVSLTPGSSGGGIDNEEWLVDSNQNHSETCIAAQGGTQNGQCWVEAGYNHSYGLSEVWFWADVRPQGGGCTTHCYYHEHDSGPLSSGDYGNPADFYISKGSSGQWIVDVSGYSTGLSGSSTYNTMHPTTVEMGQELIGTSGANAPTAYYVGNAWEDSSGTWQYHTLDGQPSSYNPPWANWYQGQTPSTSPYGGVWYTCTLPSSGGDPC